MVWMKKTLFMSSISSRHSTSSNKTDSSSVRRVFIQTIGCAMNTRDSEHMMSELRNKAGYLPTEDPTEADLILINTCSVRDKPERKLFSEIGYFSKIKREGARIGVCGCTASHMGEEILKRAPVVDFVLGARNVSRITEIIHKPKAVEVEIDYDDSSYVYDVHQSPGIKALVNISIGCDKKCSYCIVPHTRGREISIPMNLILKEVKRLVQNGVKEITLLGQNVNNYGARFSSPHEEVNFTSLLRELSNIPDLDRIRFTSPHPLHMNDEFLLEFAQNPKVCKSIHMPLQSGSSRILKSMRRGYTKEWYLNRVDKLKSLVPSVGISTDVIVGFPGEGDEDFEDTMDVLERVRFQTLYSFIYSPRPHTESASWSKSLEIQSEVASARLSRLQERHREILREDSLREIGEIHFVLVENIKHENEGCFAEGRSDNGRLVKILNTDCAIGNILRTRIVDCQGGSLVGKVCSD